VTTAARELVVAFDSLPPNEQREVAIEILRRAVPDEDLSEAAFHELAGEVFRMYDAEEAARAAS